METFDTVYKLTGTQITSLPPLEDLLLSAFSSRVRVMEHSGMCTHGIQPCVTSVDCLFQMKNKMIWQILSLQFVEVFSHQNTGEHICMMYRIMYELAVCSDGMTEAQPRSFRQNRPASEYII